MARPSAPDWDAVKRDWRTGQFSNRELGRLHGVSESTIREKARNRKWERDLAGQVQQATAETLARDAAADCAPAHTAQEPAQGAQTPPACARATPSDAVIVALAAQRAADVVRGHRAAALRLRTQLDRLSILLDGQLNEVDQLAAVDSGVLFRERLGSCAEILDTMARALGRLATVERQAFNLDGKPGGTPDGLEEVERRVLTGEQRLAALNNLRTRALSTPVEAQGVVH